MKAPFAYLAALMSAGIILARHLQVSLWPLIWGSASCVVIAIVYARARKISVIALAVGVFILGMALYENSCIIPAEHIARRVSRDGEHMTIMGDIVDDPVESFFGFGQPRMVMTISVTKIRGEGAWQKTRGLVRAYIPIADGRRRLACSDRVVLTGVVQAPRSLRNPGLADNRKRLEDKGIYLTIKVSEAAGAYRVSGPSRHSIIDLGVSLRQACAKVIDTYFPSDFSDNGFLKSLTIAQRSRIDEDIEEDFTRTGTVHILSVSGTHVGLIAFILSMVMRFMGLLKKTALALAIAPLVIYACIAGLNPPIVRSTCMYALLTIGLVMGRQSASVNTMGCVLFFMLAARPRDIFDVGLQLSFISVAGMAMAAPLMHILMSPPRYASKGAARSIYLFVTSSLAVSVSAWLASAPLVARTFNICSPIGIVANIVVIPLAFVIMSLTAALLAIHLCLPAAAPAVATLISLFDRVLFSVISYLAYIPFGCLRVGAPSALSMTVFSVVFAVALLAPRSSRVTNVRGMILRLALVLCVFVWSEALSSGRGALSATFLDVGAGDAIVVRCPDGSAIIIDAGTGSRPESLDAGKRIIAPYLLNQGIRRILAVVCTHFHDDHAGGIPYLIEQFDVGCVIDGGAGPAADRVAYERYLSAIKKKGVKRFVVGNDALVSFVSGVNFRIMRSTGPDTPDENARSLTIAITYGASSMLLCGDVRAADIIALAEKYGIVNIDVIKMPHHGGSIGGMGEVEDMLALLGPRSVVVSGVAISRNGMTPSGIGYAKRCRRFRDRIFLTGSLGAIRAITKGDKYSVNPVSIYNYLFSH